MNHVSKGLLVAAGCIGAGLTLAVLSLPKSKASVEATPQPIEAEDSGEEPPVLEDDSQASPDTTVEETPQLTSAWLAGTWGPARNNPTSNPNAGCDTDNIVTFETDGSYRDGGSFGRFRTDGTTVTYFDRVLHDPVEETEDRSQFNQPLIARVTIVDQNTIEEEGESLRRCSGG